MSQRPLSDGIRNIRKNPKLLIPADKTNNLYELSTDQYNKLLTENISKTYKNTTCQPCILLMQKQKLLRKI